MIIDCLGLVNKTLILILNFGLMRKQVGRIYCREVSISPEKQIEPIEKSQIDDLRTIRKDVASPLTLVADYNNIKRH